MERVHVINLRRQVIKTARYKRSPKALRIVREYIKRHMKSDNIVIKPEVNSFIWANGIKNPPSKVKVKAVKGDDGKVIVSLGE